MDNFLGKRKRLKPTQVLGLFSKGNWNVRVRVYRGSPSRRTVVWKGGAPPGLEVGGPRLGRGRHFLGGLMPWALPVPSERESPTQPAGVAAGDALRARAGNGACQPAAGAGTEHRRPAGQKNWAQFSSSTLPSLKEELPCSHLNLEEQGGARKPLTLGSYLGTLAKFWASHSAGPARPGLIPAPGRGSAWKCPLVTSPKRRAGVPGTPGSCFWSHAPTGGPHSGGLLW